uniref:Uncharacterized protein n=1 Tax=Rhizophora mucronata TaxID=61149 RepID=A0A2P2N994_RHIMU
MMGWCDFLKGMESMILSKEGSFRLWACLAGKPKLSPFIEILFLTLWARLESNRSRFSPKQSRRNAVAMLM